MYEQLFLLGCGGVYTSPDGIIASSLDLIMDSSHYEDGVNCEWLIKMPLNQKIKLTFIKKFHINQSVHCLLDFLEVSFVWYAYDSIHRESLINVLKKFEIPQKLINLIKMSIKHTEIKVKAGHSASNLVHTSDSGVDTRRCLVYNIIQYSPGESSKANRNGSWGC